MHCCLNLSLSECYCTNNIVVTLMEFFTLFYHIWFYKTVLITYAQFTFCLFSILFFQIPIYSIVTTCSFYFNSEKTSQRKSYQRLFARTTGTPGVFLAVAGRWTFTFIPLRILNVFQISQGCPDWWIMMWWLSSCANSECFRQKKQTSWKEGSLCLPKCVFNYSINNDKAKPGRHKIITWESKKIKSFY